MKLGFGTAMMASTTIGEAEVVLNVSTVPSWQGYNYFALFGLSVPFSLPR
jgi:hypothetical protein